MTNENTPESARGFNSLPSHRGDGIASALVMVMAMQMHSATKEQREAVRQLLHTVLTRDLGTFNPDRFKEWVRDLNQRFVRVGYALRCHVHNRAVNFVITEKRSKRVAFK